jgi:SEC-C motif-containing protein
MSRRATPLDDGSLCPCGLGDPYGQCCGRFHRGEAAAPSAEQLMRSRYTAFAVGDAAYLVRTWHSSTRPHRLDLDARVTWSRLHILGHSGGGPFDATGTVEFRAHFTAAGRSDSQWENSLFVREHGDWRYLGPHADR